MRTLTVVGVWGSALRYRAVVSAATIAMALAMLVRLVVRRAKKDVAVAVVMMFL